MSQDKLKKKSVKNAQILGDLGKFGLFLGDLGKFGLFLGVFRRLFFRRLFLGVLGVLGGITTLHFKASQGLKINQILSKPSGKNICQSIWHKNDMCKFSEFSVTVYYPHGALTFFKENTWKMRQWLYLGSQAFN